MLKINSKFARKMNNSAIEPRIYMQLKYARKICWAIQFASRGVISVWSKIKYLLMNNPLVWQQSFSCDTVQQPESVVLYYLLKQGKL